MQITHQYYYRKGLALAKSVIYTILSVVLVAFAIFSYIHWEMSFLFSEWQGYVIVIVYGLITLGIILSAFDNFKKWNRTNRGVPAFAVGDEHFVFFDDNGMANLIPFDKCFNVRFKRTYSRYTGTRLTLFVEYEIPGSFYEKFDGNTRIGYHKTSNFKVDLSELDQQQEEIEKQLKKIYKNQVSSKLET